MLQLKFCLKTIEIVHYNVFVPVVKCSILAIILYTGINN